MIIGISILLTTNPGASATSTGFFPIASDNSFTVLKVSSDVAIPLITSTSFITGAGLKKCIPITLSGLLVAEATSVIDKEDVFEASIVLSLQIPSSSANIDFLISIFSIAASTTKSQSAAKFISVVPDILERTASFVASSIFPLATNLLKFLLIPANPLSTNSSFMSLTITS